MRRPRPSGWGTRVLHSSAASTAGCSAHRRCATSQPCVRPVLNACDRTRYREIALMGRLTIGEDDEEPILHILQCFDNVLGQYRFRRQKLDCLSQILDNLADGKLA